MHTKSIFKTFKQQIALRLLRLKHQLSPGRNYLKHT